MAHRKKSMTRHQSERMRKNSKWIHSKWRIRNLLSNALKQSLDEFLNTYQNQLDVYSRIYNNAEESEREDINNQIESIKNTVKDVINYYLLNEGKNEGNQTKLLDFMYKSRYFDFLLLVIDNIDDEDLNDYAKMVRGIKDPYVTVDWRNAIINDCEGMSKMLFIPPINQDK